MSVAVTDELYTFDLTEIAVRAVSFRVEDNICENFAEEAERKEKGERKVSTNMWPRRS